MAWQARDRLLAALLATPGGKVGRLVLCAYDPEVALLVAANGSLRIMLLDTMANEPNVEQHAAVKLFAHLFATPVDILRTVATVAMLALLQSLYTLRSERSTDFLYGVGYAFFAFVCPQWIYPDSLVTVRNGRWMTR